MKVALLADIHGNADALASILEAARLEQVDELVVAGDIVGYYYEPNVVLRLLGEWQWTMVRGNHEDMLRDWINGNRRDDISRRYGSGIAKAAEKLDHDQIGMLTHAPNSRELSFDGLKLFVCHGSPWDHDKYVYPDADDATRQRMAEPDADVIVFGHTHYPVSWQIGKKHIVNPGSAGQPRDRKPGACWALLDTTTRHVELRRETYDPARLIAQCQQNDPQIPFLTDVLTRT